MDLDAAYDAVLERRKSRKLGETHKPAGYRDSVEVMRAERAAGWAHHLINTTISRHIAYLALRQLTDELPEALEDRLAAWCQEAVFDGYDLACALGGVVPAGQGRAFDKEASMGAFQRKVSARGEALMSGALAEITERLCSKWRAYFPPEHRKVGTKALANALAGGILVAVQEHQLEHEAFASLVSGRVKRVKSNAAVKHVAPRADLIARILAAPGDDEPRLVYADWLSEAADPLGEFILIQCALGRTRIGARGDWVSGARKLPFDSRQELERREKELLLKYGKIWVEPLRPFMLTWSFRRGFLSGVVSNVAAFLKGPKAFAAVPLEELKLSGFKQGDLKGFDATATIPTLRRLDFSSNRLNERSLAVLGTPLFAHAPALDLSGNTLDDAGFRRLVELLPPTTTAIDLSLVGLRTTSLKTIAPLRVTHLSLRRNGIDGVELAGLEKFPRLEWLDLSENRLSNRDVERLAQLTLPRLKFLDLAENRVTGPGLAAIARSSGLKSLEVLDYSDVQLDGDTRSLLAERFGENVTPPNPFGRAEAELDLQF